MDEARRRICVSDEEASTLAIIDTDKKTIEKKVPTGAPRTGSRRPIIPLRGSARPKML
jgi:hypothetical protein